MKKKKMFKSVMFGGYKKKDVIAYIDNLVGAFEKRIKVNGETIASLRAQLKQQSTPIEETTPRELPAVAPPSTVVAEAQPIKDGKMAINDEDLDEKAMIGELFIEAHAWTENIKAQAEAQCSEIILSAHREAEAIRLQAETEAERLIAESARANDVVKQEARRAIRDETLKIDALRQRRIRIARQMAIEIGGLADYMREEKVDDDN